MRPTAEALVTIAAEQLLLGWLREHRLPAAKLQPTKEPAGGGPAKPEVHGTRENTVAADRAGEQEGAERHAQCYLYTESVKHKFRRAIQKALEGPRGAERPFQIARLRSRGREA